MALVANLIQLSLSRKLRALGAGAIFLSGCAVIEVRYPDRIETEYRFGLVNVQINAGDAPTVVRTHGIGITGGNSSVNVGWLYEQVVAFPDPTICQAILFIEHADQLAAIQRILENAGSRLETMCIINGEDST